MLKYKLKKKKNKIFFKFFFFFFRFICSIFFYLVNDGIKKILFFIRNVLKWLKEILLKLLFTYLDSLYIMKFRLLHSTKRI